MPFNGSGVFQRVRNWVADATAGIKIRADYHDAEDDGFAAGLTNCITKDGQTVVAQNIPFNSKRITGLADPINPQDASTKAYADTKLSKTGDTLTGDLTIKKDGPQLILDDTDASMMAIRGQRNEKDRWVMRLGNGEAETGANAGSNFDLIRYDDAGGVLGVPLVINRASGLGSVAADPTAALGIATKGYVDTTEAALQTSLQAQINTKQANLGFTPVQQSGGAGQGTNKIYIGWSGSGLKAQVDATDLGAFAFGANLLNSAQLAYAGDVAIVSGSASSLYEPYAGAVVTGFEWTNVGYPIITYLRFRYLQIHTTSWFTVGYAG